MVMIIIVIIITNIYYANHI